MTPFGICSTVAVAVICAAAEAAAAPLDFIEQAWPADEAALMTFYPQAVREYQAAPNDIIRGKLAIVSIKPFARLSPK
jgi:hypothetical protein